MQAQLSDAIDYKRRFLFGAYAVIMGVTSVVAVVDYLFGDRIDTVIDLVYSGLTLLAYRLTFVAGRFEWAAIALFWISVVMQLVYLSVHGIDFNIVFALLIPIIAFIGLPRRQIVIHLSLFYLVLIGFLIYCYRIETESLFFHRPEYPIAYAAAHLFMIGYGVFYSLTIEASIDKLRAANRAQQLLLREVHHRVKNNLNLIASIMGLQAEELRDPVLRAFLSRHQRRIESMALLHEIVYTQKRFGTMDMRDYIERLIAQITHLTPDRHLTVHRQIVPLTVPIDSLIYLGIIIHEMLTNSVKHARQVDPDIYIEWMPHAQGYRLRYCDTNPIDLDKLREGFGYSLIVLAARYFGSEVNIHRSSRRWCYDIQIDRKEALQCEE
jgi:two-component sensor histidine kinase